MNVHFGEGIRGSAASEPVTRSQLELRRFNRSSSPSSANAADRRNPGPDELSTKIHSQQNAYRKRALKRSFLRLEKGSASHWSYPRKFQVFPKIRELILTTVSLLLCSVPSINDSIGIGLFWFQQRFDHRIVGLCGLKVEQRNRDIPG
ncbi:hypothetical protein [Mesorhizobium sp. B2-6-2]|uniref:hypothetical protein n=1 Tax=Mesorhizobium sp. B2-6-2 TaxID=2589915 RepID=UPI00112DF526|nr:hypothetical protein [Mesorhizobium sp. B2-6-2]TPJ79015.1 hypothetical protein FJ419_10865 [Mesorhizobium sp. B2-6-2]